MQSTYWIPEIFAGPSEARKQNTISEIAAVMGIATNFASGDAGNNMVDPGRRSFLKKRTKKLLKIAVADGAGGTGT